MIQQGQVFRLKAKGVDGQPLWAYRYRLEGRGSARPQVGGFASRTEAQDALRKVLDRLGPGRTTMTLTELVEEYLDLYQAEPVTIAKLRWLLGKATATLGETRLAEQSPKDVYAWRLTIPEGHRFEATQALRQVLNWAVDWGLLDSNPAKCGIRNTPRRAREKLPFDTWQQIEAVAAKLSPVYGPIVVFAAATGLRPSELFGLRAARRRSRGGRRLRATRVCQRQAEAHEDTAQQPRRPLQARALEALARLPRPENGILFPNLRGGRIDFRSFGRRHWKPAQRAAGIEPSRDLYDLRHTYATFALRAGVPVFAVSRFMGSSIAMIDHHYGHLAHDSRQHAVSLLDALALERAVDAAWTSQPKRAKPLHDRHSRLARSASQRAVDARWTSRLATVVRLDDKRG